MSYCKVHVNIHIEIETGELFASLCTCVLSLSCYSRTFSNVPHHTPPPLQGLQGDMVVGVNTGTPKVQVHVRERAWQGVEPDQYDSGKTPPTEVKGQRTGGGLH